jgi:hypothetical protein
VDFPSFRPIGNIFSKAAQAAFVVFGRKRPLKSVFWKQTKSRFLSKKGYFAPQFDQNPLFLP